MYCHQCGKEIESGVRYCPNCGAPQSGFDSMNQYTYSNEPIKQDESSFGWALLGFLVPIAGLILYLVWKNEYPNKAKSCIKGFVVGMVLNMIMVCCAISAFSSVSDDYDIYDYNRAPLIEERM